LETATTITLVDGGALSLTSPVALLPRVTRAQEERLRGLGITRVAHLLTHLPARYERVRERATLSDLEEGVISGAIGEISATRLAGVGRKRRFEAVLIDGSGRLDLVFFNRAYLHKKLTPGMVLRVEGKPRIHGPGLQMVNPGFELLAPEALEDAIGDGSGGELRPVYPATEGLSSESIRALLGAVLDPACALLEDHLGEAYRRGRSLPGLGEAYRMIHAPRTEDEARAARRRLAYDELLLMQLGVHMKRAHLRTRLRAPVLPDTEEIRERIRARIPFTLTLDQDTVERELARDMASSVPTNRLIQGDVGSGKTVVALSALLRAVAHGHQGALMAPTEILAEQHALSIGSMLEGSSVRVELLTGSMPAPERDAALARIGAGEADLVIGTHALVSDPVRFRSLAVAVIDEQHRFGVEQRAGLRVRAGAEHADETPHVVVMTATPIPRTIGLTLFGDLDISTIEHLPAGRAPVQTRLVRPDQRDAVYAWARGRIDRGEQAFVVVPAIDPGERTTRDLRGVLSDLESGEFRGARIAAMHGRLERATRESIMHRFRAGDIDALVATTVIEVGVDVPNASVIVIEDADRFGLAQLHQLRGRVGRGDTPGVCVLVADPRTDDARRRLDAMVETHSGFTLAQRDLEIRGPGDVFGTRQSGMAPLRVADPIHDTELLMLARRDAAAWIDAAPELDRPSDSIVRRRLLKAHGPWLGLGDVG